MPAIKETMQLNNSEKPNDLNEENGQNNKSLNGKQNELQI